MISWREVLRPRALRAEFQREGGSFLQEQTGTYFWLDQTLFQSFFISTNTQPRSAA